MADDGFGSLITLGPRKFKKKPVLTLDPEELEKAHLQFQLDGAQIMGEDAPLERAPVPVLGLAPIDAEEAEHLIGADDDEELDESDLPPLPELLADPDRLSGLAEEQDDKEAGLVAAPAPSKPRAGIDMVALRLAASLAEQEEVAEDEVPDDATPILAVPSAEHGDEPVPATENFVADQPVREQPQTASPAVDAAPDAPAQKRKTTIETATESWDLPFARLTGNPPPPEDELLLAEMFEWEDQDADWPETPEAPETEQAAEAETDLAPAEHNHIRAMLIHGEFEPPYDQEPHSSGLLSLIARAWRWLTARF
ncbi:hypothetical protein [Alteraurantiacibacter aestuarii]|uniref:hypothetical protein n=1 Tax=Alteraurantiacibacter aestuarii TaxID=650004 RepID=UPI0031D5A191